MNWPNWWGCLTFYRDSPSSLVYGWSGHKLPKGCLLVGNLFGWPGSFCIALWDNTKLRPQTGDIIIQRYNWEWGKVSRPRSGSDLTSGTTFCKVVSEMLLRLEPSRSFTLPSWLQIEKGEGISLDMKWITSPVSAHGWSLYLRPVLNLWLNRPSPTSQWKSNLAITLFKYVTTNYSYDQEDRIISCFYKTQVEVAEV